MDERAWIGPAERAPGGWTVFPSLHAFLGSRWHPRHIVLDDPAALLREADFLKVYAHSPLARLERRVGPWRAGVGRTDPTWPRVTTQASHPCPLECVYQHCMQPVSSAPSPHWRHGHREGRDCGERAGVRGPERAMWPPHPDPLPRNTHKVKDSSIAGEREQKQRAAYFSEAHTPLEQPGDWSERPLPLPMTADYDEIAAALVAQPVSLEGMSVCVQIADGELRQMWEDLLHKAGAELVALPDAASVWLVDEFHGREHGAAEALCVRLTTAPWLVPASASEMAFSTSDSPWSVMQHMGQWLKRGDREVE